MVAPAPHNVDLARKLVRTLGGRYSREAGIDLDRGGAELERWLVAAALFSRPISAGVAVRTYRALDSHGAGTPDGIAGKTWAELVELLDSGGYVRYDFSTASRLRELAEAVRRRPLVIAEQARESHLAELERTLDELPGWGPTTVRIFLRELPGPAVRNLRLDPRALAAGLHVGLLGSRRERRAELADVARGAGLDARDLEAALVRLALRHGRRHRLCPAGDACQVLPALGLGSGREPSPVGPGARHARALAGRAGPRGAGRAAGPVLRGP